MTINYKKDLNPQQLEVVINGDGPCLVLAGAGSGKTRAITYRVAYLLEQKVNPDNILLLTFTNKAANEMIERIKQLTGMGYKMPYAGTFHSIANKILRVQARELGYESNFTILDNDDSQSLLKICVKDYKPDTNKKFPSVRIVQSVISYARNAETTIDDVLDMKHPNFLEFSENIKNIAQSYADKKKQSNAMDFDDLLVNFLLLLNKPRVLEKYSNQFKYILVDEYQDTNKIQASIIRKLSLKHNNVLVVGDDAQSIYSFRAADIKNILDFEKKYSGARIFKLETNYRSSQEILEVANNVIENNLKQYKKELNTLKQSGIKPVLNPLIDQREEAVFIADTINKQLDNDVSDNEIAVLFRAAFHSQMLEMELMKRGIEYDYRGGLRFFDRAHIKDVLAYLRILNNLNDSTAWLRILMHEDGIGSAGAQKIIQLVTERCNNIEDIVEIGNEISNGKAKQGWENFVKIWKSMLAVGTQDIPALIETLKVHGYQEYLEAEYENAKDRLEDIDQLAVFAESAKNLDNFLSEASLQENTDLNRLQKDYTDYKNKIVLSTIHQAKGLEWENVFIINLAGGAFPSDRAWKEQDGIEEERRLFYVAITRAKNNLYLTYPQESSNWSSNSGPSIFIEEISTNLLDDRSFLSNNSIVFDDLDDESEDVKYVDEDDEWEENKRSFVKDLSDL